MPLQLSYEFVYLRHVSYLTFIKKPGLHLILYKTCILPSQCYIYIIECISLYHYFTDVYKYFSHKISPYHLYNPSYFLHEVHELFMKKNIIYPHRNYNSFSWIQSFIICFFYNLIKELKYTKIGLFIHMLSFCFHEEISSIPYKLIRFCLLSFRILSNINYAL